MLIMIYVIITPCINFNIKHKSEKFNPFRIYIFINIIYFDIHCVNTKFNDYLKGYKNKK